MKATRIAVVILAAAFATLLGSFAVAKSMWQTVEFEEFLDIGYVGCLGEDLTSHYWITIRYREFQTPSGTSHYIDHWTWDGELVGQATGRVWLSTGGSAGSIQAAAGEVSQWTSNEVAIPVVGEGPRLRYNQRFKYTVNANGELKVFAAPPDSLSDWFRCLGPKD